MPKRQKRPPCGAASVLPSSSGSKFVPSSCQSLFVSTPATASAVGSQSSCVVRHFDLLPIAVDRNVLAIRAASANSVRQQAVEFVEAPIVRQITFAHTLMPLADQSRGIALQLQSLRDRRLLDIQSMRILAAP